MPEQTPPKKTGLARILKAFLYTRDGLVQTFKEEAAFRQELLLAAVLLPIACRFAPDRASLAAMVSSVILVLIVELLNSALEAAVNRFGPEWNAFSKHAKDGGSAAVFVAFVNLIAVWLICLL